MKKSEELGVHNVYNENYELVKREYILENETVTCHYQKRRITKVETDIGTCTFNIDGNLESIIFKDHTSGVYSVVNQTLVFFRENNQVLGWTYFTMEKTNHYFAIRNAIIRMNRLKNNIVSQKLNKALIENQNQITACNEQIINSAIQILMQENRYKCKDKLESLQKRKEALLKLSQKFPKFLPDAKIKSTFKRKSQDVKLKYEYEQELKRLKILQKEIASQNDQIQKLLRERQTINSKTIK